MVKHAAILLFAVSILSGATASADAPRARYVQPKPGTMKVTLRYGQHLVLPKGTTVGDGSHAIEPVRFTRSGNPVFDLGGQVYVGKDTILSVERSAQARQPKRVSIKLGTDHTVKVGFNEELALGRGMRVYTNDGEIKPVRVDDGRPVFKGLGGQYWVSRGDGPMTRQTISVLTVERK